MAANGNVVMEGTDSQKHTSLRYLRLQNDFRNMIKSGMDVYDEQVRAATQHQTVPLPLALLIAVLSVPGIHGRFPRTGRGEAPETCLPVDKEGGPNITISRPW